MLCNPSRDSSLDSNRLGSLCRHSRKRLSSDILVWLERGDQFAGPRYLDSAVSICACNGCYCGSLADEKSYRGQLPFSATLIAFSVFAGLLFIVPSVGVLMWLEKYNRDLWRMYGYVPVGAAVALVSLLVLASPTVTQYPSTQPCIDHPLLVAFIPSTFAIVCPTCVLCEQRQQQSVDSAASGRTGTVNR